MNIKPIRTKRDYEAALKVVESLMSAKAGSADGDRLGRSGYADSGLRGKALPHAATRSG